MAGQRSRPHPSDSRAAARLGVRPASRGAPTQSGRQTDNPLPEGEGVASLSPPSSEELERAYASGLRFLASRPRSASEMRRRLSRQYAPDTVDSTIRLFEGAALLDDAAFATYWVDQRQQFSPRGPRALRAELRQKGIASGLADAAIEPAAASEGESAYRAGLRHARRLSADNEVAFSRSLAAYLARRGFGSGAIRSSVRRLWNATQEGAAGAVGASRAGPSRNPPDQVG